jgi:anti-anti-sigma factor
MKIDVQAHGSVAVLAPNGALTREEVDDFRRAVGDLLAQRSGRIVVDMRGVPYLDSAGIEVLLSLYDGRRPLAGRPTLARLTEACREALDLTDCLEQLDVFDTVENAIRSYAR